MAISGPWSLPPASFTLADNELHVWRARLPCGVEIQSFEGQLSLEEKKRAERFLAVHAKEQFVASRGILRELLSAYVGIPPGEIALGYGAYGKPMLSVSPEDSAMRFNASHSHGYAVYAFAAKREVGIDVEQIRSDVDTAGIAERFFSKAEIAELSTLPPELRVRGFFKCWTRKEAYLKARGLGLQIALQSFSVSIRTGEVQEVKDGQGGVWSVYAFEPDSRFVGAVAAEGTEWRVRYFEWRGEQ